MALIANIDKLTFTLFFIATYFKFTLAKNIGRGYIHRYIDIPHEYTTISVFDNFVSFHLL